MLDYIRVACAVPPVSVGNVQKNTEDICAFIAKADAENCDLVVFPELAMTGYTCADLFQQQILLNAVQTQLRSLCKCSEAYPKVTAVVGLPLRIDGQLYNCAAVLGDGAVRGVAVKSYIPNYEASSEARWFAPAQRLSRDVLEPWELGLEQNTRIYLGDNLIIPLADGARLGVEICEDLWAPISPSSLLTLGGAEIIVNPAASHDIAGKRKDRRELVAAQSTSAVCAYAFCSAGSTESTQDLVCSGHSIVAQCGQVIGENEMQTTTDYMLVRDVDLGLIRALRLRNTTFGISAGAYGDWSVLCDGWSEGTLRGDGSLCVPSKLPFIPKNKQERLAYCREVFDIQVAGLMHRLDTIKTKAVIGISGGLDSTLALLVAVEAMRRLGRPLSDVHGITMPCFGTSDRTYQNAWELMRRLEISSKEINIRDAVSTHFRDIGHDPQVHNTTYENAQARERTQILMDYAGEIGGIVIGTGDLSELALGWCTYNGDHMSMYGVNGSVPKTLIRWIIEAVADTPEFAAAKPVLEDVLDTPISPELLPPDAQGKISQQTEDIVGPYALHDFFLYHVVRYGFTPTRIYTMACRAFAEDFDAQTVKKWLRTFYHRFFTQQFKRNCQPDGVRACVVGLGPRGDWRMPSDATAKLWLEETDSL